MTAPCSRRRPRPLGRFLRAVPLTALLLPLVAHAQTSTLPPTDITNGKPTPSPASEAPVPASAAAPASGETPPPVVTPTPAPAPMPSPPPSVVPTAAPAPAAPPPAVPEAEPLAGFSDGNAFLRSPDNAFILFPNGRLQVDSYLFHGADKTPNKTFLIRRARAEVGGWMGSFVYFWLAGDFALGPPAAAAPAAPANIGTTDDYVAIAPWKNLVILQVGQFDGSFTLENRTSDKYFDFMERSITVRAFGIPDNKEMGALLHGFNDDRNFYYSVSLVNGDGQNFKNADQHFDWMGRAWIAPLSFLGDGPLHDIELGGSFWTGERANTLAPTSQTTQGGFTFLSFSPFTATEGGVMDSVQLRQNGRMNAFAGELNAPIAHKFGVRGEVVWKHSPLSAENIAASGAGTVVGGANLKGYSTYGEAWFWLLGDDRIIGDQQGLEPFTRYKKFGVKPIQDGLMLAFRYEHLDEDVTPDATTAALALGGVFGAGSKTKVDTVEGGVNYWHSKRFRATFNYVFNHFGGDTALIKALPSAHEQEFLFRLAVAL